MAGLSGALSGLSGVYGGYKQGELDEYKIDDVKRSELAKVAMGNALQLLAGGPGGQGGGGGPQPPPPGQPSPPMMPPGGMPRPPMGGPPPGMPPQGGGMPGGAPQGGPQQPGGKQLDWRQLVQAVQQANPNIKPDVMAEAVNQFLPMMNAQSQQEWRMVSLQIREEALKQREQQFTLAESGRNQRADTAADTRRDVATINTESREKTTDKRLKQQDDQFQQREARLEQSLKLREDSTWARLEQQKQAAIQRAQAAGGKQGLAEIRAIIDAQDKHVRTKIAAASANNTMKPDEKKKLLDQADKEYNDQIEILRNQFGGKGGAAAAPAAGAPPSKPTPGPSSAPNPDAVVIVQSPEEAEKLKPGTHYKTPDGKEFTR
jgi:hypothetical protein